MKQPSQRIGDVGLELREFVALGQDGDVELGGLEGDDPDAERGDLVGFSFINDPRTGFFFMGV